MSRVFLIILGMALVTYIPRVVPFYIMEKVELSKNMRRTLGYIPFAALGAMIVPGGFTAIEGHPIISTLSLVVAVILAYLKGNIFISVVGSVLFGYIALLFN